MPTILDVNDIQTLLSVAGITDFTGHYTSLGGGEGNDTFVLDCETTKLVLRVAKYSGKNNLGKEAQALRLLNLDKVPRLVYFDESKLVNDKVWILETYLGGEQVEHLNTGQLKSLGELLANVHHVQSESPLELNFWEEFLYASRSFGDEKAFLDHPDSTLRKLIHRSRDYFQSHKLGTITPSLIHGDVSLNNMLASGNVISLIDWEFSRFTDPMADFSTLFYEDMEYNKGRWRIHITEQDKTALFSGYSSAGGVIDEQRLKAWHNFDKLGGAVYLYWKLNHSGHNLTLTQSVQYEEDLDKLSSSLERNL